MTYELNKKLHNKIDSLIDEYCDNEELLLKLDCVTEASNLIV